MLGAVQGAQIRLAIPDANHCPGIAAPKPASHSSEKRAMRPFPIRVRVDITEKAQCPHPPPRTEGSGSFFQKVEERWHGRRANRLPPRRKRSATPRRYTGYVPVFRPMSPASMRPAVTEGLEQFANTSRLCTARAAERGRGSQPAITFSTFFSYEAGTLAQYPRAARRASRFSAITGVMLGGPSRPAALFSTRAGVDGVAFNGQGVVGHRSDRFRLT